MALPEAIAIIFSGQPKADIRAFKMSRSEATCSFISNENKAAAPTISADFEFISANLEVRRRGSKDMI